MLGSAYSHVKQNPEDWEKSKLGLTRSAGELVDAKMLGPIDTSRRVATDDIHNDTPVVLASASAAALLSRVVVVS